MGVGSQPPAPATSTSGKDPVPIVQEAGWAPGPVWTGGKSRPHRDSIPDLPARSQSLNRLSYPAHKWHADAFKIIILIFNLGLVLNFNVNNCPMNCWNTQIIAHCYITKREPHGIIQNLAEQAIRNFHLKASLLPALPSGSINSPPVPTSADSSNFLDDVVNNSPH